MRTCLPEISPNCPGHQGWEKFGDCLTEALYHCDHDQTTGTVDGFGMWVGLVIQEKAETLDSERDLPVTIPAATYVLIIENEQGHVTRLDYDSADNAQDAFDIWDQQYGAWEEAEEAREFAIIHSTGRVGA